MTKCEREARCARQHAPTSQPHQTTGAATANTEASGACWPAYAPAGPSLASHTADPHRRGQRTFGSCGASQSVSVCVAGSTRQPEAAGGAAELAQAPRWPWRIRMAAPERAQRCVAPAPAAIPAGGPHQTLKSVGYLNSSRYHKSHQALKCPEPWLPMGPPGGAGGARIGCGTAGEGAAPIGETSAKRLSANSGTGDANGGTGRFSWKGLNAAPPSGLGLAPPPLGGADAGPGLNAAGGVCAARAELGPAAPPPKPARGNTEYGQKPPSEHDG